MMTLRIIRLGRTGLLSINISGPNYTPPADPNRWELAYKPSLPYTAPRYTLVYSLEPQAKLKPKPVTRLNAEGRAKARAIMFRFTSEGTGRIETEIKENRVAERYARLSRPVSQREFDKWKERPITEEMLKDITTHKNCCDLFEVIVEKLTSEYQEQ